MEEIKLALQKPCQMRRAEKDSSPTERALSKNGIFRPSHLSVHTFSGNDGYTVSVGIYSCPERQFCAHFNKPRYCSVSWEERESLLICAWGVSSLYALAQPSSIISYPPQHRDHEKTWTLRKPLTTDTSVSRSAFSSIRTCLHSISLFVLDKFVPFAKSGGSKKKMKSQPVIYACFYIPKLIKNRENALQGKTDLIQQKSIVRPLHLFSVSFLL